SLAPTIDCPLMIMGKWSLERPDRHDHDWWGPQPRGDLEEKTNSLLQATVGFGVSVPGLWSRRGVVLSDMEFSRPATWADALAIKAEQPAALAIAGGTDVMVDINFDRVRPAALLDLTGIGELAEWSADGPVIRLGAGVPYARVISELGGAAPGRAARAGGARQTRTGGGGAAPLAPPPPAGAPPPPLLACDTVVEAASVRGTRDIPIGEFFTGVKRSALAPDELIAAVRVP